MKNDANEFWTHCAPSKMHLRNFWGYICMRQTNWVHFHSLRRKFIATAVVSIHWGNVWHSSWSTQLFWTQTWTNWATFVVGGNLLLDIPLEWCRSVNNLIIHSKIQFPNLFYIKYCTQWNLSKMQPWATDWCKRSF